MSWTKQQFITAGFEEIGFADYLYDLQPEQFESALRKLDSMMATLNGRGIRIGYPIPSSPENSSLAEETNVPDWANEAIYTNLAIRLAPSMGKQVSRETKVTAHRAYTELLSRSVQTREQQLPGTMPAGAGNKTWSIDQPFLDPPSDPLEVGPDATLDMPA